MKRIAVDPRSLTEMQVEKRLPPRSVEATNAGLQSRREAVAFRRAAAATAVEAVAPTAQAAAVVVASPT